MKKEKSSADECPKCGGVSYRGGYCFSCGVYRPSKPSAAGEAVEQDFVDYLEKSYGTRLGGIPQSEEQLEEKAEYAATRRAGHVRKPKGTRNHTRITITAENAASAALLVQAVVRPIDYSNEGKIITALEVPWRTIVSLLEKDWSHAAKVPSHIWEEMIAAAFDKEGYDEVTLTPRSGDHGRDVIAVKRGVGSIRIIDSVKAFKPGHLVKHDDVRTLAGVLLGDPKASKGILSTTSDFAPKIKTDPFLAALMPYRLELMNGERLRNWLGQVASRA